MTVFFMEGILKMDNIIWIKELLSNVSDEEDFIISIPIFRREEVYDGRKEIQAGSSDNQNGQGKASL